MKEIKFSFGYKYKELFTSKARYFHFWGGRGRGGSYTATQYALLLITSTNYFRGYFMREVFSDVRDSLWRDFKDRIEENETLNEADFAFNDSQMTVTYLPTGNTIIAKGFKKSSGNRTAKLKSLAGATHVFIEESEEVAEEDFRQLDDSLRTVKADTKIIMVFNPPHKSHWILRRWYNLKEAYSNYYHATPKPDPSLLSIHSTYKDNKKNLNQTFINNLVGYQSTDPDYFATMVEGLITEGVKGRIYRNWQIIKDMPNTYQKFYGLDFGFNDPVALVEIELHNRNIYCKQLIYQSGMTNREISDRMKALGVSGKIIADSAEPKSITELQRMGWNVSPAVKGPDSVKAGIKYLKEFVVHLTEESKDFWLEYENYKWALNAQKEPTDQPEDGFDHLMDALRMAVYTKKSLGTYKML